LFDFNKERLKVKFREGYEIIFTVASGQSFVTKILMTGDWELP